MDNFQPGHLIPTISGHLPDSIRYGTISTLPSLINIDMQQHHPLPLSPEEWAEVVAHPLIRQSWGLDADDTVEQFARDNYGVRFDFRGAFGYSGDLILIVGDTFEGGPFMFIRDAARHLEPVTFAS